MSGEIGRIRDAIMADAANAGFTARGWKPVFAASAESRILLIGQAPGRRAQESGIPWSDASGDTLVRWLGVDRETFHDPAAFAIVPMDFYFPGKASGGDAPPRRDFAAAWHPSLFEQLANVRLTVLVGAYAQRAYLPARRSTLTETVQHWRDFRPEVFPVVHPSPRNIAWQQRNPWFEAETVPELRTAVAAALADPNILPA
ncbi:Uracil-DNA glycosylase [Agromyces sp. CF514]|uniref:uracil-DNA glycosylase family protein n=1 Tax=Agromyces sp. CF514 TaxID=1881031 RepID=UPI0008E3A718|nr:uracil-DNA glycosylase family protein [Agromyces sp. CF514]SFR70210.1 Uracil-DNA glycosylase [Agromyces sp. CF514]